MEAHRHSTEEARGEDLALHARVLSGRRTHGAEAEALLPPKVPRDGRTRPPHRPTTPHAPATHPATTSDRLRRPTTPMHPEATPHLSPDGVPPRRRALAALLSEGRTDAVIAARPGMNIRTTREHPAARSHTQLGYRTGESGILEQKETDT
ncbi:hypothetical protein [Streptomyces acidiscabies]|uniref:hypothetical protein n=1 Tax=Streptomyces acidiscabies TaxID=42234 RepID=UPI0038F6406D